MAVLVDNELPKTIELKNPLWSYTKAMLCAALLLSGATLLFVWLWLAGTPVNVGKIAVDADHVNLASPSPQVIRLWPNRAPGSETWSQQETELKLHGDTIVRNVVDPTMTAYFPSADKANGTAMIICPGGGFHMLSMTSEGSDVAHYLNSLGITAFILSYRLTETNEAFLAVLAHRLRTPGGMRPIVKQMTPLILEDGQQAVRVVRLHAAQWGLSPDRIGIVGFSAGGYLALNVALHHDAGTRPDFVAAIYAEAPDPLRPVDRIPLFLLCAKDDSTLLPAENSVRVYTKWHAAHIPVELHIFDKGGHGFGMRRQNLPVDAWPELLHRWLESQGDLAVPSANTAFVQVTHPAGAAQPRQGR